MAKGGRAGIAIPRRIFHGLILIASMIPAAHAKPNGSLAPSNPKSVPTQAVSAPGFPWLDSVKVHKLYMDGDFEEAIEILENNLKDPRQYRHDDSVFIFKHLGVMYAAQYETREKGKYFMHRLLMVEPTAKIMDMYASDMIYMIFKNIQDEYEQNRMQLALHGKALGNEPKPDSGKAPKPAKEPQSASGAKWIWTGAAVATVAVGVGTFFLLNEEPRTKINSHDIGP